MSLYVSAIIAGTSAYSDLLRDVRFGSNCEFSGKTVKIFYSQTKLEPKSSATLIVGIALYTLK